MTLTELEIPGVLLVTCDVYRDERGWFQEFWNPARMRIPGLPQPFVQDNTAFSRRGVLRGLHFQQPHAQAKLVTVLDGEIFDVAVDIRPNSATFGKSVAITLSGGEGRSLYVPAGFAHGYQVLSASAHVLYKCTEVYHPEAERTLAWNDPKLGIAWPLADPIVSPKDAIAPTLEELSGILAAPSA